MRNKFIATASLITITLIGVVLYVLSDGEGQSGTISQLLSCVIAGVAMIVWGYEPAFREGIRSKAKALDIRNYVQLLIGGLAILKFTTSASVTNVSFFVLAFCCVTFPVLISYVLILKPKLKQFA